MAEARVGTEPVETSLASVEGASVEVDVDGGATAVLPGEGVVGDGPPHPALGAHHPPDEVGAVGGRDGQAHAGVAVTGVDGRHPAAVGLGPGGEVAAEAGFEDGLRLGLDGDVVQGVDLLGGPQFQQVLKDLDAATA